MQQGDLGVILCLQQRATLMIGMVHGYDSISAHMSSCCMAAVAPSLLMSLTMPLAGSAYELRSGKGCVCFEARGETDVTLILKPTPGAKRWQPLARAASAGPGEPVALSFI
jgi:hypothetical protein